MLGQDSRATSPRRKQAETEWRRHIGGTALSQSVKQLIQPSDFLQSVQSIMGATEILRSIGFELTTFISAVVEWKSTIEQ
jgi:hypothetical protein